MKKYDNGILNITNDDYHASSGLSRSALWKFKQTPALYQHEYLNPLFIKPEQTPAMALGNLVHCLVLEPKDFEELYIVAPKMDRRTKQGKADWLSFQDEAEGKIIVTEDQIDLASNMNLRLEANETFRALLDGSKVEQSIYFTHERTGIQCKVRPDIWAGSIIGDLKTTESASPRDFQGSAFKYGYYLQAAMIHEALRSLGIVMEKFVFAVVEKKEPHLECLYLLEDDALQYGLELFDKLMSEYAECLLKNEWPGYGIQSLSIPGYAQYEE